MSGRHNLNKTKEFDQEGVKALATNLAEILTESKLSSVEMAFALAAVLRGLGEATYDKPQIDKESVFADYKVSPSWPAALILHADLIPEIWELFIQEREDPQKNIMAWKAHGEKLKND